MVGAVGAACGIGRHGDARAPLRPGIFRVYLRILGYTRVLPGRPPGSVRGCSRNDQNGEGQNVLHVLVRTDPSCRSCQLSTAACSDVWGHTKVQVRSPSAAALTVNCASAATLANVGCRMEHWVVARSEQSHAASTCRQRPPWPRRRRRRLAHRPESHECGAAAWSAAFHVWRGGPGAPPPPQLVRVQRYARRGQLHLRASGAGESAAGHTALTPRAGATSAPSFSPGGHML